VLGTSGSGGALFALGTQVEVDNTIVAGNFKGTGTVADDVGGSLTAASSSNLIGTGGSGGLVNNVNGNQVGVANPLLGAIGNNGGPTQTVRPLTGSPAINKGNNAFVNSGDKDQRGFDR